MRILFLTHSFNSLTQRLYCELSQLGHQISIEFDITDSVSEEAVALFKPDLILAFSQTGDSRIDLVAPSLPGRPSRHRRGPWAIGAGLGDPEQ